MQLNLKIWLGDEQEHGFLGEGRIRLLQQVHQRGSLTKAAQALGISYRKAWGDIRAAEKGLGFDLITRRRGGSSGGASTLNTRGVELLEAYAKIQSHLKQQARRQYVRILEPVLQGDKTDHER